MKFYQTFIYMQKYSVFASVIKYCICMIKIHGHFSYNSPVITRGYERSMLLEL